jgi:hypothetical protein
MSEYEYVGAEARKMIGGLVTAFVVAGGVVVLRAAIVRELNLYEEKQDCHL